MQRARCAFFEGLVAISLSLSGWAPQPPSFSLMESGPTSFPPSFVGGPRCLHFLRWSRDPLIVDRLSAPPDRASRCGAVRRSRLLRMLSRRGGCARNACHSHACGAKALLLFLSLLLFALCFACACLQTSACFWLCYITVVTMRTCFLTARTS